LAAILILIFAPAAHLFGSDSARDSVESVAAMIDIEYWQEEMLAFNPWARRAWKIRSNLIEAKVWNLNALDQGGNQQTNEWLKAFFAEREQASLQRWRQGREACADWAARTQLMINAFDAAGLWDTRSPGSPPIPTRDGRGALANLSPTMPEYTRDFLMADVLLLARADFSGLEIGSEADFSGYDFPAGVRFSDSNIGADVNFEAAHFGDHTSFAGMKTQLGTRANFSKARFERWADFTMADIGAEADFADSIFGFASSFEATTIGPKASFERAEFAESVSFAGANIGYETSFIDARFGNEATFEAVTFGENVSFDRAVFQGIAAMPNLERGKGPSFNGTSFNGPLPRNIKYDSEF